MGRVRDKTSHGDAHVLTEETAPVAQPCADGYSGCGGVADSGVHVGSAVNKGFPPPASIAVTGRQKLKEYLALKHPISASASPVHSIAIMRAVSAVLRPSCVARPRNARAYCCPVCSVQNRPISV